MILYTLYLLIKNEKTSIKSFFFLNYGNMEVYEFSGVSRGLITSWEAARGSS